MTIQFSILTAEGHHEVFAKNNAFKLRFNFSFGRIIQCKMPETRQNRVIEP